MDHAMNMRFDPFLTGLSMLIAIGSSPFALWLVSAEKLRLRRLLPGALVMGLGISAMHYTGMAALQFASIIVWNSAGCPLYHYRATGVLRRAVAHVPPAS